MKLLRSYWASKRQDMVQKVWLKNVFAQKYYKLEDFTVASILLFKEPVNRKILKSKEIYLQKSTKVLSYL
jgi:hypothetical protein